MQLEGLRLLLVGPLPPPAGGMATQTAQLKRLLEGEGVQVELVQTNAAYRPAWLASVPVLRAFARLLPYLWALWRACGRAQLLHLMANSGWSWHLFAAPAIAIARLRGVPVLVNYRGGEAEGFLARSRRVVAWTLNRVQGLVVPSGFLVQVFERFGWRAQIVPNVVDLALFQPGPARPPGQHLVVTRNLEALYDNASAIRALAELHRTHPECRLTLAGSGPQRAELEALVAELGLQAVVRFAGRLERRELAALLHSADVLLNPSLADNMPNSLLEAMASGVPVVSTRVGGVPFMVEHGRTALLVPPKDPGALAAAVRELLDNPARAAGLREAGLQEALRYTWQQVAPCLAQAYRRCMP
ncbi:glycosyltransferase family 4 protein [Inhella proteolytica]|uniref:Glycosyltransferase family 4 protein n=1 Tax=Inhella proteolytica TaxID=2795029 RepID=A0A931J0L1_9BURK|nr:glycosyltransferase family 4 protein [Inhella proteolytica]MBH9576518.1 glycosyltransferase family 4 protein [Inhella proteolytica]